MAVAEEQWSPEGSRVHARHHPSIGGLPSVMISDSTTTTGDTMDDWEHGLGELVRTRHRSLMGYAYLLSGDVQDAEDLVQDALVKVFSRRSAPQPHAAEAYVRRAIYTIYLDGYRRRTRWSRIRHLTASADHQESTAPSTDAEIDVAAALQRLSPRQRACVLLRHYDDLTVPQIADELGIAEGTVRRHVADAHVALRGLLADLDPARVRSPAPATAVPATSATSTSTAGHTRFAPAPSGATAAPAPDDRRAGPDVPAARPDSTSTRPAARPAPNEDDLRSDR